VSLTNQVCGTLGSISGEDTVDGNRFIALSYGYSYGNLWKVSHAYECFTLSEGLTFKQNYGIIIAFGIAFFLALLLFTEYNTHIPGEKSITLFKRGASALALSENRAEADEEKGAIRSRGSAEKVRNDNGNGDSIEVPMMSDIFTWRHMEYDVSLGKGESRRLLDDISGFVAPGKLTALMGESGAGKVRMNDIMRRNRTHTRFQTTLLNVLAERQAAGVVRGERLVNGYPLPSDFQAQTYVQATLFYAI
jgi:ATP-binding cassette subfamily G (WHITE) protein 2 (SNQ2)